MSDFGHMLAITVAVITTWFIGPGFPTVFLVQRKRRMRARRRTPIGIAMLRSPGQTLREQLEEAENDFIWDLTALATIPPMLLTLYLALLVAGVRMDAIATSIYLLAFVSVVAFQTRKLLKAKTRTDKLKNGFDAELAVGQELDRLMHAGAWVFHDVPADAFNIDHVVVAPQGLFAIETKGYTKANAPGKSKARVIVDGQMLRFPDWTSSKPLEQAARQAAWLSKWTTAAIGSPVSAVAILALPGWFVEEQHRGAVRVYSGRRLAWMLTHHRGPTLSPQDIRRVAHQLDQRCRTVKPTYAP